MPAGRIAVDLNERDVPTARDVQNEFSGKPLKGYQWTTHAVVQHLRSDATRGYVLHYPPASRKGEPKPPPVRVVDETGEFVRREPLIDDGLWLKLQEALDASTKKLSGKRAGGAVLAANRILRLLRRGAIQGWLREVKRAQQRLLPVPLYAQGPRPSALSAVQVNSQGKARAGCIRWPSRCRRTLRGDHKNRHRWR